LLLLIVLAVLGGLGYGGWRLFQTRADADDTLQAQDVLLRRIGRQLNLQQGQLNDLEGRIADIAQTAHDNTDQLAAAQSRLDDADHAVARLGAAFEGGHLRVQLLAVEQLLLLANDRLQLGHDVPTALNALKLAQDRLGSLADPDLFDVRKAVADEYAALSAVPRVDIGGAALALGAAIERVPQLPLVLGVPERFESQPSEPAKTAGSWRMRLWAHVEAALHAVFTVRYTGQKIAPALDAEQRSLVVQVLALKLEVARAELLRGDAAAFKSSLRSAAAWLQKYFRSDDPGVLAVQSQLEQLQDLELAPTLPDLSRSVELLRAHLNRASSS
jgi:uroporphyrin-3 C-methyltransferase